MALHPVILSGGSGTRLWPVSRELHPKPFIRLADGETLLQKAFVRAASLDDVADVLTVTNRELFFKTSDDFEALPQARSLTKNYILEPFGRNTAPAVAIAAQYIAASYGDDAVMLVLPADHIVNDQRGFAEAVREAHALALDGRIVVFGVKPHSPETGYGYIEADHNVVKRFVEKPTIDKANEYLASGRFLWNAGMFCFKAGVVLAELAKHSADLASTANDCYSAAKTLSGSDFNQLLLDAETFEQVPDISVDYALAEKSTVLAVVPCDIGWSDVGSWSAISDLSQPDAEGNRVVGDVLIHGSSNCFVQVEEQRVAGLVGVRDLIVIDTPDALLVADRSRSQDVKHIVAQLKLRNHDAYRLHREVHRPWGTYTVLEEGSRFKIKRIVVKPGASLSLQMHHHRSEHWIVVSGTAKVVNGDNELLIYTNESTFIPAGHRHRLENPGVIKLVLIEVQSGEYLGEDDIVRFNDRYGRVEGGTPTS
ncbi:mannose-1-phosphate guanylyltransferase/mannose-6-phosphate isomerase [Pararobbsia alpina]|uniref:mannose-1-phosphate guanylyltransferase n=1 Tax=Pararobbsia alpina TaxID=621374 RepID=A0A6S7BKW6_9BURK|nr:mannose-1-phosphate guanylyltransferase/mannose-6-phosphate isomerase [Pararobbsia alpina]CAB3804054.1 Alginate biosynthesis protein AlgA [Pararobbsia alpina]